jgi:hypothetical protein
LFDVMRRQTFPANSKLTTPPFDELSSVPGPVCTPPRPSHHQDFPAVLFSPERNSAAISRITALFGFRSKRCCNTMNSKTFSAPSTAAPARRGAMVPHGGGIPSAPGKISPRSPVLPPIHRNTAVHRGGLHLDPFPATFTNVYLIWS